MTPEAARNWKKKKKKKIGVKMQTLRIITCSEIPQSSKRGVMNDSLKSPEIQNWGSFLQNVHLWPHIPL